MEIPRVKKLTEEDNCLVHIVDRRRTIGRKVYVAMFKMSAERRNATILAVSRQETMVVAPGGQT